MKLSKALRLQPKSYILIILILAICIMVYIFYKNSLNTFNREGFGGGIMRGVSDEALQRNTDNLNGSQKLLIYSIINNENINDNFKIYLLLFALPFSGIVYTKYNEILYSPYYLPWMAQAMGGLPQSHWAKKAETERGYVQFSWFDYRFNDFKYFPDNARKIAAMRKLTTNGTIFNKTITCQQLSTNPTTAPSSLTPVTY